MTPDGQASVWFEDSRLLVLFGFAGGPLGGRIDPSGKYLYFTITISAEFPFEAVVYRLALVDHPTAAELQVVHRFGVVPGQALPQATGLAFAASGNIYVSLIWIRPATKFVGSPARCSTRHGASPSWVSRCW